MSDISEFIYGDEYAEKNKAFAEAMDRLEEKYADYFKSRPPINEADSQDRLHNHYNLRTASGQISFKFIQNSDLAEEIKTEAREAFHRIWKYETPNK